MKPANRKSTLENNSYPMHPTVAFPIARKHSY